MEQQLNLFQSRPLSSKRNEGLTTLPEKLQQKLQLLPDPELFNDNFPKEEMIHWVNYLYANPKPGTQKLNLRTHIIGLYDPFAPRKEFPAGRRWCVNVYVGCAFYCKYCYIISYIRGAFRPRVKRDFQKLLLKDLEELQQRKLRPTPIHVSNSTDPLQPIEKVHKDTLFLLQQLQKYQRCFSTITILTKNPILLCTPKYLKVIQSLKTFQVEVTCPFYQDEPRKFFEPGAPKIESRFEAIRILRKHNIKVALRIDPIFPRNPLPKEFFEKPTLHAYDAPQSQTEEDIEHLIRFASEVGCSRIIVSPLKLTAGRLNRSELLTEYRKLYAAANNGKLIKKGAAYRLPWPLYHHWIEKPTHIADSLEIPLVYCKKNLFDTY
jgi:DNA repair photolyase